MYTCTPSPCHLGQQAGGQVGLLGGEVEADEMAHETHYLSDTTQSMHRTAIYGSLHGQLKTTLHVHMRVCTYVSTYMKTH